jgi:Fic family protein
MRPKSAIISAKHAVIMTYIHETPAWPQFRWDDQALSPLLASVRHKQGRLVGRLEVLGFDLRSEAVLQTITSDVVKSSEIEGERLNTLQVRSSIARRLGMNVAGLVPAERNVEGIVEMMLDATQNHEQALTKDRLYAWHAALFPTGRSGMTLIRVGDWRDDASGAMQVVSGPIGREKVHFQAPSADRLDHEMADFLAWFETEKAIDLVLAAGIAHLCFITIHPFQDGNGRIARAISDMALARSEQSGQRFYSMSSQIRAEREDYYDQLETAQKGGLNITRWLTWFLGCLSRALDGAELALGAVISKARFWEAMAGHTLNDRQTNMLNRLQDGFEGKLTTSKWAKLSKCSQDTALRDIEDLVSAGVLRRSTSGGRSTNYELVALPSDTRGEMEAE